MKHAFAAVISILAATAAADLDRIDADGVTETGGTSAYARMLPRTGANGKLSATLLPPVADWASQPIAGLYYVSAGVSSEGNGSPQYPFKTLTYAASHASTGSALLVVPATYSGSLSLASGKTLTLCGLGPATYVSSLSVAAEGTSESTELRLCGLHAGTLAVTGGRVNIRLMGATIDNLTGSATAVTVTRTDLGSYVYTAGIAYTDAYTGYSTVPQATILADSHAGTTNLTLAGGRARFHSPSSDETVAYVSDITSATNAVYVTVGELGAEDVRLAGLVAAEADIRTNADTALSHAISNAVTTLNGQITLIGSNWSDQLTVLSDNLSGLRGDYVDLYTKETNDVRVINASIDDVRSDYQTADSGVKTLLRGEMSDAITDLRDEIPGMAQDEAEAVLAASTNAIIDVAVEKAATNTERRISAVMSTVQSFSNYVQYVERAATNSAANVEALTKRVTKVETDVSDVKAKLATETSTRQSEDTKIRNDYAKADTELKKTLKQEIKNSAEGVTNSITSMVNSLVETKVETLKTPIINKAVEISDKHLAASVKTLNEELNSMTNTLKTVNKLSNSNATEIVKIKYKIDKIIDELYHIKNNETITPPDKFFE